MAGTTFYNSKVKDANYGIKNKFYQNILWLKIHLLSDPLNNAYCQRITVQTFILISERLPQIKCLSLSCS